jgi:2-keto-4-pentenoate hydratase/2-oxohepta-3-ene-1,7-dioic acid hydratase in catechol pathway
MLVGISKLVSYGFSQFDLHLGEVIATSTPSGVGLGLKSWLRPGDSVGRRSRALARCTNTVAGMLCLATPGEA